MVFCVVAGVSIHRIPSLPSRTTHPAEISEQRNVSRRVTAAAKILALVEQPAETSESRRSPDADVVAEDITIHHQKPSMDLDSAAIKKPTGGTVQAQLLPLENMIVKRGVLFTFGKDSDSLVADTLTRYGADASASRIQDQKRAALHQQAYK
ncbi:MAG: hypothetical protein WA637_19150 [Terriglobales bacterium]